MIRAAIAAILFSLTAVAAPPQVDWLFPIGAQRGSEALAQIGGKFQWPLKTWADDPGIAITADAKKKGFFKITVAKGVTPGPHLVRFYDGNGTAPPRVFFVSKAPDVPEKEPNNEMLLPQAVDVLPAVVHGKLQSGGDVDSYRVKLKAGQFFIAQLDAYTAGVSMDALMLLRDHRGVKLAFNHDAHSLDPRLVWQCDRDGEYVLQVAAQISRQQHLELQRRRESCLPHHPHQRPVDPPRLAARRGGRHERQRWIDWLELKKYLRRHAQ